MRNLLRDGEYYFHAALLDLPPPPVLRQDGSWEEEAFRVRIRNVFTANDLVDYFYDKHRVERAHRRSRDIGAARYLLQSYTVDELLFAIDEAYNACLDGKATPLDVLIKLEDYIVAGRNMRATKEAYLEEVGIKELFRRVRRGG